MEFWEQADVNDFRQGFIWLEKERVYQCLFCGAAFAKGVIYTVQEDDTIREDDTGIGNGGPMMTRPVMVDAQCAARIHIRQVHGSSFKALVGISGVKNGLSDLQKEIVSLMYQGHSDADMARMLGNKAQSTIRNHRYNLKEKYKESKLFMAIMEELVEQQRAPGEEFIHFHSGLTVNDDRVRVTEKEKQEIIDRYFKNNTLVSFPKKQKRKLVLLQHIAARFEKGRQYTEKEVNEILEHVYDDYVSIRRYLIEYGFLDRTRDGATYWLNT